MNHNKNRRTQIKTIFEYLQNNIATATMVAEATGIRQKNICRYKADLEKSKQLAEVKRARCVHTGRMAYYITTNPKWMPINPQLNLFTDGER